MDDFETTGMVILEMPAETMTQRRELRKAIMAILDHWLFEGGAIALTMMGHERLSLPEFGTDVVLLTCSVEREDELRQFILSAHETAKMERP